jgi:hypothetical protein
MPQAFASSGAQLGIGSMLTLATVTLFWVAAVEDWVEATAPVRARTTTTVRTIDFMA